MKSSFLFVLLCGAIICSCKTSTLLPDEEEEDKIDSSTTIPSLLDSDYLFDMQTVSEIRLDVELVDWNRFLNYFDQNPHNEECIPARFTYKKGGQVIELDYYVGLRLRGNTSRRRPEGSAGQSHNAQNPDWHHCHFVVKFGEYKNNSLFCENDRIGLKWHKDDAAYCREVYSYDLFRRFNVYTAPRVAYTRLTINVKGDPKPAYFGVYVMIEGVNDSYVANRRKSGHFVSQSGNLWKASWGANLSPSSMIDKNFGVENVSLDPSKSEGFIYDLKTNKKQLANARDQLKDFVNNMNPLPSGSSQLKDYLEKRVDVDQFLRAYSVNVMVGMWDDYWVNTNNYYFYFDGDGKFYFIPYDYDNTLGTSHLIANAGTQNMLAWGDLSGERMLMRKIMSIPEYQERYKKYIKELAQSDDLFKTEGSIARINTWHSKILQYVSNDTGEDMAIIDKPAEWGNCHFYRIFTGNEYGGANGNANFFKSKIKSINF
ncbi:MAG: CotH kinase family protein [Prevotellaceae bacterium]|jgi:spore coat protein CotH|nr:CotH kinase family protein [Prevotellaceae bacterium]